MNFIQGGESEEPAGIFLMDKSFKRHLKSLDRNRFVAKKF